MSPAKFSLANTISTVKDRDSQDMCALRTINRTLVIFFNVSDRLESQLDFAQGGHFLGILRAGNGRRHISELGGELSSLGKAASGGDCCSLCWEDPGMGAVAIVIR